MGKCAFRVGSNEIENEKRLFWLRNCLFLFIFKVDFKIYFSYVFVLIEWLLIVKYLLDNNLKVKIL